MITKEPVSLIVEAAAYASEKHLLQRRKGYDQLPYINHPLQVARHLADEGHVEDKYILASALLHDVVEDTETTVGDIEQQFGTKIASIVAEVTDDPELDKAGQRKEQIEKAPKLSPHAQMIKIADKTCNIRDLMNYPINWDKKRKLDYVEWAGKVVDGVRGVHPRLEGYFDRTVQQARELFSG
jgi:guanosine-3',5'-bis(diphosphate) 3'-pyrophosphohydrolase